ncbi:MAG: cofactor-independent phosphoglycerate mutase [Candidatus Hadarchaeum sp.]|uniref:cofactor-independent phosphoglycerate mutase n=1 Tax=Candidatus Hadarchaeum sp. TaxID=2883567 RepID=UPI003D113ADF
MKKKFIIVVGDGMADYPVEELGGRTPLEVAEKPNLDRLASEGKVGLVSTIPPGMSKDSAVAALSILGYDPKRYFTGRGPLVAGSMGFDLGPNDVAFRCNLVTEKDGRLIDYSGGCITTDEAAQLLRELQKLGLGEFHLGVSYRHIFVLRNAKATGGCSPPHDIVGEPISKHLIRSRDKVSRELNKLMLASRDILANHPVNLKRVRMGQKPANMVWLWSPGKRPDLEPFEKKYGVKGAIISAVNVINGIGAWAGMEIIKVPGATGYYDTNYEGKADYALKALKSADLVFVHVEAPDEAGHAGDAEKKIKAIEDLDRRLVGRILKKGRDIVVAVLPDHPTPIKVRTHTSDPVPFTILASGLEGDGLRFTEADARKGSLGLIEGKNFMKLFLSFGSAPTP